MNEKNTKDKLTQIRNEEIKKRKQGSKTNINIPSMLDLRWRSLGKGRKNLMPAMIEMYNYIISKINGGDFLDVGCGEAEIIWRLLKENKCERLVGIDISSIRIWWDIQEAMKREVSDYVSFLFSYAETLVFEDESFDYVANTATLEHITEPQKAISEIMRVLKRNGTAFFGVPIEPNENQPIKSPDHYHFWKSEKEVLGLFNNLKVVSTKFINPNLIVEIKK